MFIEHIYAGFLISLISVLKENLIHDIPMPMLFPPIVFLILQF